MLTLRHLRYQPRFLILRRSLCTRMESVILFCPWRWSACCQSDAPLRRSASYGEIARKWSEKLHRSARKGSWKPVGSCSSGHGRGSLGKTSNCTRHTGICLRVWWLRVLLRAGRRIGLCRNVCTTFPPLTKAECYRIVAGTGPLWDSILEKKWLHCAIE